MPYSIPYLLTHDIDWFIIINGVLVHAASAGGLIPDSINVDLWKSAYYVASLPANNKLDEINTISESFLSNMLGIQSKEGISDYLLTFKCMAQKGIYSFDRTYVSDFEDNRYHLVAWPKNISRLSVGDDILFGSPTFLRIEDATIDFENPASLQCLDLFEVVKRWMNAPSVRGR